MVQCLSISVAFSSCFGRMCLFSGVFLPSDTRCGLRTFVSYCYQNCPVWQDTRTLNTSFWEWPKRSNWSVGLCGDGGHSSVAEHSCYYGVLEGRIRGRVKVPLCTSLITLAIFHGTQKMPWRWWHNGEGRSQGEQRQHMHTLAARKKWTPGLIFKRELCLSFSI